MRATDRTGTICRVSGKLHSAPRPPRRTSRQLLDDLGASYVREREQLGALSTTRLQIARLLVELRARRKPSLLIARALLGAAGVPKNGDTVAAMRVVVRKRIARARRRGVAPPASDE